MDEDDLAEEFVKEKGWKKVKGIKFGDEFCSDIKDRDLECYYIEVTKMEDLEDFDISQVEYWVEADGERETVFEDIDALIEHIEENCDGNWDEWLEHNRHRITKGE